MKHIIFDSEITAQRLNNDIFNRGTAAGIFAPGTLNYGVIKKHPHQPLFALVVDDTFLNLFTEQERAAAVDLTGDWEKQQGADIITIINEPISNYHKDPQINRRGFLSMPILLEPEVFIVYVIIKHYRGLDYIGQEVADRLEGLKATNNRILDTPGGPVPEFNYFYQAIQSGIGLFDLMRAQLAQEDAAGRFNNY